MKNPSQKGETNTQLFRFRLQENVSSRQKQIKRIKALLVVKEENASIKHMKLLIIDKKAVIWRQKQMMFFAFINCAK